jgi:hypothetical protein
MFVRAADRAPSWARSGFRLARTAVRRVRRMLYRARFETARALSPLRHRVDRVRHRDVQYLTIDVEQLNTRFPIARRQEVARAIADVVGDTDRHAYFRTVSWYNWRHRHLPRGLRALDDAYPPNFAVLDFLARHVAEPESEVLLDFACGIGVLLVYERDLGFTWIHGFDNWTYVARSTAKQFLHRFGLDASVLADPDDLPSIPATIVTCIGFPVTMLMETSAVLTNPSVKYLLVDRMGRPATLPGFRRAAEYGELVTVFQRSNP